MRGGYSVVIDLSGDEIFSFLLARSNYMHFLFFVNAYKTF